GEDARIFTVPEACLSSRSLFFKKVLSGNWKEAEDRTIKLPGDDGDTLELYLCCVFGHRLPVEPDPTPAIDTGQEERLSLAKLYVFGENIQDVRVKNVCIKTFLQSNWKIRHNNIWWRPNENIVNVIYKGTEVGSPMCRLLFDILAH
ncbi:uncharacterized protein M421DRAFT_48265, partial [Didymella exigua CBS 183.55]